MAHRGLGRTAPRRAGFGRFRQLFAARAGLSVDGVARCALVLFSTVELPRRIGRTRTTARAAILPPPDRPTPKTERFFLVGQGMAPTDPVGCKKASPWPHDVNRSMQPFLAPLRVLAMCSVFLLAFPASSGAASQV